MNLFLLNRQLGSISASAFARAQNQRLLQSLQGADNVKFSIHATNDHQIEMAHRIGDARQSVAHAAGVNSICIDRFEGRYLLSGGADSSVAIWHLDGYDVAHGAGVQHSPLSYAAKTSTTERLGITHISFYPFDSLAFLSSGYDQTIKLFSSETLRASATFDLGSTVYSHATSNIASHLLVACASQHPAVRLIDLRSGSTAHSLAGHVGSVLAVAWHPRNEHILASGAIDGCCRLWDIRSSANSLGVLDMDDNIGIVGYDGRGTGSRRRERGKAHDGAVNGIVWTEDGQYLVTNGRDERMRVWNMLTGANTLANFGPALKNPHTTVLAPLLAPDCFSAPGSSMVFYPNPQEIFGFDLHSGTLLKRLRVTAQPPAMMNRLGGARNVSNRTTCLAWREHNIELYSAHTDGSIRCWLPKTLEDVEADNDDDENNQDAFRDTAERKRKHEDLDEMASNSTKRQTAG